MFTYNPLTEEECEKQKQFPLLEPGIYNFQVTEATAKTSQSGNPMIELKLRVWDNNGKEFQVYDYLIGTDNMTWKTKHFCDAVGLEKEYKERKFHEGLCNGRAGKASIVFQAGKKKPDGGFYKDKNAVEDYVMTDSGAIKYDAPKADDIFTNDVIPF